MKQMTDQLLLDLKELLEIYDRSGPALDEELYQIDLALTERECAALDFIPPHCNQTQRTRLAMSLFNGDKKDAVHLAVPDKLFPIFCEMPCGTRIGGQPIDVATVAIWQDKIDKLRLWSDTIEDHIVREQYRLWLKFYQDELDDSHSDSKAEWWRQLREDGNRRLVRDDELRRSIQIPDPPQEN